VCVCVCVCVWGGVGGTIFIYYSDYFPKDLVCVTEKTCSCKLCAFLQHYLGEIHVYTRNGSQILIMEFCNRIHEAAYCRDYFARGAVTGFASSPNC
jgi:hypothetical protein